jgi:hypothetical protein
VTIREVSNELVHEDNSAGGDYLFSSHVLGTPSGRGTHQPYRDIVVDIHIEHNARLGDESDMLAGELSSRT